MNPDAMLVEPESLANALQEVAQQGNAAVLAHLRQQEPALVGFIEEKLATIAGHLALSGTPARVVRGVHREALFLILSSLQALRRGHYALWRDTIPAERLLAPELPIPPKDNAEEDVPF